MSEAQQFCLRWHNYQSSLLATLPQLLDWDDLTDVTLYAGGCSIKAHRIVLSACSQYFKSIFKELQPAQHPVIVVPGAEFSDLSALVTFMYNGEVNVYQHQLPGLIALADTLHINGLAHFSAGKCEDDVVMAESAGGSPPEEESRSGWLIDNKRSKEVENGGNGERRPTRPSPTRGSSSGGGGGNVFVRRGRRSNGGALSPVPGPEDLSKKSDSLHPPTVSPVAPLSPSSVHPTLFPSHMKEEGNLKGPSSKLYATCLVCGKQLSNQYNLRVHMETHRNAHYACSSCSHVSRSRDALRKHVSYRHPPQQQQPQQSQPPPPSPHENSQLSLSQSQNFYQGQI